MTFLPTPTGEYTHNRAGKAVRIERKGAFYEALFVFGGAATVLAGFARGGGITTFYFWFDGNRGGRRY